MKRHLAMLVLTVSIVPVRRPYEKHDGANRVGGPPRRGGQGRHMRLDQLRERISVPELPWPPSDPGDELGVPALTAGSKTTRPKPNMADYLWR